MTAGALALVAASGCGGGDGEPSRPGARTAPGATSRSDDVLGRLSEVVPGRFPDRPQLVLRFDRESTPVPRVESAEGSGDVMDGAFRLRLERAGTARAPAPEIRPTGDRAVLVAATLREPQGIRGRAGVFCRGSSGGRSGYQLTVDDAGMVRLARVEDGRRRVLARDRVRLGEGVPPGQPVPVSLLCSPGRSGGLAVGYAVGAREISLVDDPEPLLPGENAGLGLVLDGQGDAQACFAGLSVTVAVDP